MSTKGANNNATRPPANGTNANAAAASAETPAVAEPSANGNAAANANKAAKNAANKDAKNAANKAAFNELSAMSNAVGGRRRTKRAKRAKSLKGGKRRISKGASKWNQFVMRTFKEMRKKNKTVKLMDAMKECAKQKKKGVKY